MAAVDDIGVNFAACAAYLGRTVTYSRGTDSASVTACPGGQPVSLFAAGESMAVQQHGRQWYILAASLADTFTLPHACDRITDTDDTTWAVVEPEAGGACYEFADPASVVLRIFTKRY